MNNSIDLTKMPKIRNREEARVFSKILKKAGKSEKEIKDIVNLTKRVTATYDTELLIKFKEYLVEGEKVKLNINKICNNPDWDSMQETYKEFVINNADKIFTVKYDDGYSSKSNIVRLAEDISEQQWLFFESDLLVFDESDGKFKEMYLIEQKG